MESTAESRGIAAIMQESAREIADFDEVVRLYWPRIYRFAFASLRDRDAAQTLAQDCFLRAYRGLHLFRGESSLKTWLMQIAVNLVRDRARLRKLQFWKRASLRAVAADSRIWIPDGELDPERRVLIKERVDALWSATECLPERQRTVFLLRYVEEMQLVEIAAAMGLKKGTVKIHLHRALRSVRSRVGRSK